MNHLIKLIAVITIVGAAFANVAAQEKDEYSRWDFSAGYSTVRPSESGQLPGENGENRGFEGSVTRNVNRFLGVKFDYGRHKLVARYDGLEHGFALQTFTGGIQVKDNSRSGLIKPFAHALFGTATGLQTQRSIVCTTKVCSNSLRENKFTMIFGGGVDIRVARRVSIRALQVDYVKNRADANSFFGKNRLRVGAGIVLHADEKAVETRRKQSEYNRFELHAGYTLNRYDFLDNLAGELRFKAPLHGYNASFKWNFHRYLGAEFEQSSAWSGTKARDLKGAVAYVNSALHTYAGGIQVKDNSPKTKIKPFAHALFGVASNNHKINQPFAGSTLPTVLNYHGLMMIFGGGLDIKLNERLSLRPIQVDILRNRDSTFSTPAYANYYRFGAGIVLH